MGGEPTFVSIDDMDGAEWNTAALGPTKRELAGDAAAAAAASASRRAGCCTSARASGIRASRCRAGRSAATGARDGEPLWQRRRAGRRRRPRLRHGADDAERFVDGARRAARRRPRARASPAYEDAWHYLWRGAAAAGQRRSARAHDLDDPEERARLRARLRAGARTPSSATCCRCARATARDGPALAVSGPWFLRARAPVPDPRRLADGLRLPLDSLPWVAPERRIRIDPIDRAWPAAAAAPQPAATPLRPQPRRVAAAQARRRRRRRGTPQRADATAVAAASRRDRHRAHRAVRRAARRHAARLPAAGRVGSRTTSSWSPRSRTPPRALAMPVLHRRLPAAARSAPAAASRSRPIPA